MEERYQRDAEGNVVDLEIERLRALMYGDGEELTALTQLLQDNEDDPAFVLTLLARAISRRMPKQHTADPDQLQRRRDMDQQALDALTLVDDWLRTYPYLADAKERRMGGN